MNAFKITERLLSAAIALAMLAACGSGSRGDITGTGDDTGSEEGELQGYGSVIVNGTRYATGGSTAFRVEGSVASEDDLRLGMIVTVDVERGQVGIDGAAARAVSFTATLEGPIESRFTDGGFIASGVEIVTSQLTRVYDQAGEPSTLDALAVGDVVAVSGGRLSDGGIAASYVRQLPPRSGSFILRGTVQNLDAANLRFALGGTSVDYSGAGQVGDIEDGDKVEVRGQRDGDVFAATRVVELRDADAAPPDRVGVRGPITRLASGSSCPTRLFAVDDDRTVRTSASTVYEQGSCADIALDRVVGVIGRVDADGVLVAERIAVVPRLNAALQAEVEQATALATASDSAQRCRVRVFGDLFIDISADTRQGDPSTDTAASDRSYRCSDIETGALIAVAGRYDGGALAAAIVQPADRRNAPSDQQSLEFIGGPRQDADPALRQFTVLDTTVQVDDTTEYPNSSEAEIFAAAQAGESVAAIGNWNGNAFLARRVVRGSFDPRR